LGTVTSISRLNLICGLRLVESELYCQTLLRWGDG